MRSRFARLAIGAFTVGAALRAQPPANFEATVQAAMARSIAQQRAAIQQQASMGGARSPAQSSFFLTPFSPPPAGEADCAPMPAAQLESLIDRTARKTGVDAPLVRAVVDQESGGRPCAVSSRGAEGLMQLMPATAAEYDVDDPFDPQQNVEAGSKLLKSLLAHYRNDPKLALGAYNAGAGRVDQTQGLPSIPETMDYVSAILAKLRSAWTKTGDARKSDTSPPSIPSMTNSGWQTPAPSLKKF